MATIRYYIDNGYGISAHHEVPGGCSHSSSLDLVDLASRLGLDFDLTEHRARFLAMLTCSACAKRPTRWRRPKGDMGLIFSAPTSMKEGKERAAGMRARLRASH